MRFFLLLMLHVFIVKQLVVRINNQLNEYHEKRDNGNWKPIRFLDCFMNRRVCVYSRPIIWTPFT